MSGNMLVDLERSIFLHLTSHKPVGAEITIHMQQILAPELADSDHPTVINCSKLGDRFAPENGGGPQSLLTTKNLTTNQATLEEWPDGYSLMYDFVVYSDDLALLRTAEAMVKDAFPPRKPVYLYDTTDQDNPVLTNSYADIVYGIYVNRDDSVERRYQRHIQISFEVYNYSNATPEIMPLITEIHQTVVSPTLAEQLIP